MVVTKTRQNSDTGDGELFPPQMAGNYTIFQRDRVHAAGGGVLIAISSEMICSRELSLATDCELLWVKINKQMTVFARYLQIVLMEENRLITRVQPGIRVNLHPLMNQRSICCKASRSPT